MKRISDTTEKRIVVSLGIVLLLLCTGLWLGMTLAPEAEAVVENRSAMLYDAARAPAVPAGSGININTADVATLDTLPGIGKALAERIVAHREQYGDFLHPEAIMEVSGIGEKTYEGIKDLIKVQE